MVPHFIQMHKKLYYKELQVYKDQSVYRGQVINVEELNDDGSVKAVT